MRYGFAGDREISVQILNYLISKGYYPEFLLIGDSVNTTHAADLIKASKLESKYIFSNKDLKSEKAIAFFKNLNVDYVFGIHYPYILKKEFLDVPKIGVVNLHPAYLPYNKGWHTPTWSIIEDTIYGATLHFMTEKLDNGDIISQEKLIPQPEDTANSLYSKVLKLELDLFKKSLPLLASLNPPRKPQNEKGTSHIKNDIQKIQKIDLEETQKNISLIKKLRALTTNKLKEAAYFEIDNKKYFVQIKITPDEL